MRCLGEGSSHEELRAEAAIEHARHKISQMNRDGIAYMRTISPIASPMYSGVDGDGWRIDTGEGVSFFLKLYQKDTAEFVDLDTSFKAAAAAANQAIAPKLLWSAPTLRAAIWEYKTAPWRAATFEDSANPDVAVQVACSLRQLHAAKPLGKLRSVFTDLKNYVALAQERAVVLPVDFNWMLGNVQYIERAISAAGFDLCACHGDLIASNIMIGPRREVLFVDWDEAGDSDPYWDLGMYMAEAFPFDQQALAMIESYAGQADVRLLSRARLYAIAGDLAWAVRSLIMAHQTERLEVEYFKYAHWRALRCRVALHDPKFEQMLRFI